MAASKTKSDPTPVGESGASWPEEQPEPASTAKIDEYAVYDAGNKVVVMSFNAGTAKEQKEAAEGYIERVTGTVGAGPGRDLRLVTIKEA